MKNQLKAVCSDGRTRIAARAAQLGNQHRRAEQRVHPLQGAEEALDLLPDAMLRVLPGTGYLIAYDDAVGVARELGAFCG